MLTPIHKAAKGKAFTTYDLEWWPDWNSLPEDQKAKHDRKTYKDMSLRLVGVYDKERGFRHYKTIAEFLDREMTHAARGRLFFAHAGGSYDVQFILQEIISNRQGWHVEAMFSGASAVMVKVKRNRQTWTFCDSFFLMRSKLADIGKWIGQEKGTKEDMFTKDMAVLIDYNRKDCMILYAAIERLQNTLLGLGGELRATIASCAMTLFRRAYLGSEIATTDSGNEFGRKAYVASRVEVFERECGPANYWDINSSFPWSMCKPQPASMLRITHRVPDSGLYLLECDLSVPASYLPPLPYRTQDGSRIFFPSGTWNTWLDCTDVRLLEAEGGKIEKVYRCAVFEEFGDLAGYVRDLYERKAAATDTFERILYKYLLNALYGKFAERSDKRKILINPEYTTCQHAPRHGGDTCMRLIMPGVYEISETMNVAHAHVPISAHVTAESRGLLFGYLKDAMGGGLHKPSNMESAHVPHSISNMEKGHTTSAHIDTHGLCKPSRGKIYYCDTDSIVTDSVLESGEEIGQLKLEHKLTSATFVAPKLYSITDDKGKSKVRSKGFRGLSLEEFRELVEGEEVMISRMARVRENLNDAMRKGRDEMKIKEVRFGKRLRPGAVRPKRKDDGKGGTLPWKVEEVEE